MFQPIIAIVLLSLAFIQPTPQPTEYPNLEASQPLTTENVASIEPLAALGSDTPERVVWSPDGQTLAAVTSGHVFLYKLSQMETPFLTIPRRFDERVTFADDGQLTVGSHLWDIEKGSSTTVVIDHTIYSPGGHLAITSTTNADKETVATMKDDRTNRALQLETGVPGLLEDAIFSPDEQFVVLKLIPTSTPDQCCPYEIAQLWDLDSGTMVAVLEQALEYIDRIAFHADGQLLVTTSYTDAPYGSIFEDVRVWDGRTGSPLNDRQSPTSLPVVFSRDQQLMIFSTGSGLSVWTDHNIGTLTYHTPDSTAERYGFIGNPRFSADGKYLLAMDGDRVLIWDTAAIARLGEPRLIIENGSRDMVSGYFLSAKGDRLVVNTSNGSIRVWDISQHEPFLLQVISGFSQPQISLDSEWLWAIDSQKRERVLLDAATGAILGRFSIATQLDRHWKYAAYWSQANLNLVNLADNTRQTLQPLHEYAGSAHYYDIGSGQAAFSLDDTLKVYDLQTGSLVLNYEDPYRDPYQLSDNGQFLWSIDNQSFDGQTATSMSIHETARPEANLFSLSLQVKDPLFLLLPEQQQLASIVPDGGTYRTTIGRLAYSRLNLWSILNGQQIASWTISGGVQTVALNSTQQQLALVSVSGTYAAALHMVDLTDAGRSPRTFELPLGQTPAFQMLKFSPNDPYFAVAADNQLLGDGIAHNYQVFIWDTQTLAASEEGTTPKPFIISGVQSPLFSPDNRFILCLAPPDVYRRPTTSQVQLWSLKDQVELGSIQGDDIAAFNPDSQLLAVHNRNQTHILSVQALANGDNTPIVTIPNEGGQVKSLAFSPDGTLLYLVEQSRVRVYGIPSS